MSPQASLGWRAQILSTGTVECCRRARVSDSCFTPPSPKRLLAQQDIVGGDGDGGDTPAVRGNRLLEEGRQGLHPDSGSRPTREDLDGEHLGCHDGPDPDATRAPGSGERHVCGHRVHQRLLETVLLPARRRPGRDTGQRRFGAQSAWPQDRRLRCGVAGRSGRPRSGQGVVRAAGPGTGVTGS